jgi:phospholipid/cholesterol/gamma-HCH transport system substrate-binding protein
VSERIVRIMTGLISLVFFGAATVLGVYLGAGKFSPKYHLRARFTAAGQGLQTGSDVKVHGVNVGQVTTVHLVQGEAEVHMALHQGQKVPAASTATIRPKTLFGEKFVDIDPGANEANGPFLKNNGVIKKTVGGFELEQVLTDAYPILRAVQPDELTTLLDSLANAGRGEGQVVNRQIGNFQQVSDINVAHDQDTREFLDDLTRLSNELANRSPDLVAAAKDLNVALPDLNNNAGNVNALLTQLSRLSSDAADLLEANRPFMTKLVTEGGKTLQLVYDLRGQVPPVVKGFTQFFQVLGEAAGTLPDPSSPGTTLASIKFIVGGGALCGGGHDPQHPPVPCEGPGGIPLPIPGPSSQATPSTPGGQQPTAKAPVGPITVPPAPLPVPVSGVQAITQLVGGLLH